MTKTATLEFRAGNPEPRYQDAVSYTHLDVYKRQVLRLGKILEEYGTYESNGIAISDVNEIWWLETIGGHHWMARRVPDDAYVTNPNQLRSDYFEFGNPDEFLCDPDLEHFVTEYHLILDQEGKGFNPRYAFGSPVSYTHLDVYKRQGLTDGNWSASPTITSLVSVAMLLTN